MIPYRKLVYYLLLNVFVSACVTLTILYLHDRQHRPAAIPNDLPLAAKSDAQFEIAAVIGAGIIESEMVLIRNTGASSADLIGWQISDGEGNRYTFSALTLPANAAIQLRTSTGNDTVIDLYWGLTAPLWHSGKIVTLLDPQGSPRSVFQVP